MKARAPSTDLHDAVECASELAGSSLTGVDGKASTGEVKGVHDQERGGSGKTSRGDVSGKARPEASRAGNTEPCLVVVLEGEVERLGGEVTDHVGPVSAPESSNSLLLGHTDQDVRDTSVVLGDLGRLTLVLEQQLDALNGGRDGLGHSGGDTTEEEVLNDVCLFGLLLRHAELQVKKGSVRNLQA